jgi:hypothetical protein
MYIFFQVRKKSVETEQQQNKRLNFISRRDPNCENVEMKLSENGENGCDTHRLQSL